MKQFCLNICKYLIKLIKNSLIIDMKMKRKKSIFNHVFVWARSAFLINLLLVFTSQTRTCMIKSYLHNKREDSFFIFVKINPSWKRVKYWRVVVDVDDEDIDWNTGSVAAIFSFQYKRITLPWFKIKRANDEDCTIIWVH